MQKIHEQKKLFIGNIKVTEICYPHFSKKAKQINLLVVSPSQANQKFQISLTIILQQLLKNKRKYQSLTQTFF